MAGCRVYKNPSAQPGRRRLSGVVICAPACPSIARTKLSFSVTEYAGATWQRSGLRPDRSCSATGLRHRIGELGFSSPSATPNSAAVPNNCTSTSTTRAPTCSKGRRVCAGWHRLARADIDRERPGWVVGLAVATARRYRRVPLQYFFSDATFEQDENAVRNPGTGLTGTNLSSTAPFERRHAQQASYNGSARYNKREARTTTPRYM